MPSRSAVSLSPLRSTCRRHPARPDHPGRGDPGVVARRRRYYKTQIDGQLSFEDLVGLVGRRTPTMNRYGTMARSHWATVAAAAVRDDPGSGQLLLDAWGRRQPGRSTELAAELAGDDQPGEGYLEKAGRLTAARSQAEEIILPQQVLLPPESGDERGPGGERPGDGERGTAAGHRPQPPAVGGGERRAAGTGPGQLTARTVPAARPGRSRPLRNGRPHPREPGRAHHAPRHPAREPPGDTQMSRRSWPAGRAGARSRRYSTPIGERTRGPATSFPACLPRRSCPRRPATP